MPTQDQKKVKNHHELLQVLFEELTEKIKSTEEDNSHYPEAVILSQLFENKLDYFKELNSEDHDFAEKLANESNDLYKRLYKVYDRTDDTELIQLLTNTAQELVKKYVDGLEFIGELDNEKLIEVLQIRDKIKVIFDEIELWKDKFTDKDQIIFERHNQLFASVKATDVKLKDELIVNNREHQSVYQKGKEILVKPPNGSQRFNFWWWYAGSNQ